MQPSINLLYPATSVVGKVKKGPDMIVVLANTLLLIGCIALYGYLYYQQADLSGRIADANAEVEALSKPIDGEVANRPYVKERNEMQAAIKEITDTKKLMSKPLDEIAAITDPDITIRSVGINGSPPHIVITGTAPTKAVVARFMGNIQASKYFSNGYIKSMSKIYEEKGESEGYKVKSYYSFDIEITPNEGVFKK